MPYRTKTYIAADWDGDKDVVDKLHQWNDGDYWSLHFVDAHDLTQSRDTSLNCSIKRSLADRLAASKTFVLVVGSDTISLRAGSCQYCGDYLSASESCLRGNSTDTRSYIQYECDYAARNIPNIVVIYNYANVDRGKCPESLRYRGEHVNAYYYKDGKAYWNYPAIRDALGC